MLLVTNLGNDTDTNPWFDRALFNAGKVWRIRVATGIQPAGHRNDGVYLICAVAAQVSGVDHLSGAIKARNPAIGGNARSLASVLALELTASPVVRLHGPYLWEIR